ncbi:Hypothetical predicted protein, partial [Olea europaea subsp. europaea]
SREKRENGRQDAGGGFLQFNTQGEALRNPDGQPARPARARRRPAPLDPLVDVARVRAREVPGRNLRARHDDSRQLPRDPPDPSQAGQQRANSTTASAAVFPAEAAYETTETCKDFNKTRATPVGPVRGLLAPFGHETSSNPTL